jgi:hypothetical protein
MGIKDVRVTRQSIREYARAIRDRYRQSNKEGKTKILDEFTKITGLHRKAAIRLLNQELLIRSREKLGRPRKYGNEAVEAARKLWIVGSSPTIDNEKIIASSFA